MAPKKKILKKAAPRKVTKARPKAIGRGVKSRKNTSKPRKRPATIKKAPRKRAPSTGVKKARTSRNGTTTEFGVRISRHTGYKMIADSPEILEEDQT